MAYSIKPDSISLGDSFELMKYIPSSSCRCIVTGIPFGMTSLDWDNEIPYSDMWKQLLRIGTNDANFIFLTCGLPTHALVMSNPKLFKHTAPWIKSISSNQLLCHHRPMCRHEDVTVFSRPKSPYNPQMIINRPPYIKGAHNFKTDDEGNAVFLNRFYENQKLKPRQTDEKVFKYYPTSPLIFPSVCRNSKYRFHPTQKPLSLLLYLVASYSNKGDTVLDPFCGIGEALQAAQILNRKYIGIDITEKYVSKARQILKNEDYHLPSQEVEALSKFEMYETLKAYWDNKSK